MTTIRATCPSCGDVRLKASDVVVRVCANDNKGSYCFRCPSCGLRVTKSADSRSASQLESDASIGGCGQHGAHSIQGTRRVVLHPDLSLASSAASCA